VYRSQPTRAQAEPLVRPAARQPVETRGNDEDQVEVVFRGLRRPLDQRCALTSSSRDFVIARIPNTEDLGKVLNYLEAESRL
jgi:hypothetical protein